MCACCPRLSFDEPDGCCRSELLPLLYASCTSPATAAAVADPSRICCSLLPHLLLLRGSLWDVTRRDARRVEWGQRLQAPVGLLAFPGRTQKPGAITGPWRHPTSIIPPAACRTHHHLLLTRIQQNLIISPELCHHSEESHSTVPDSADHRIQTAVPARPCESSHSTLLAYGS